MRGGCLPAGHELLGPLPLRGAHQEGTPPAAGSRLHVPGLQDEGNHPPDRREALHLHRQLYLAGPAAGRFQKTKTPSHVSVQLTEPVLLNVKTRFTSWPFCCFQYNCNSFKTVGFSWNTDALV